MACVSAAEPDRRTYTFSDRGVIWSQVESDERRCVRWVKFKVIKLSV